MANNTESALTIDVEDEHAVKRITLPTGTAAIPPLAVSGKRGLACIMGDRSCMVDIENEEDDGDDED